LITPSFQFPDYAPDTARAVMLESATQPSGGVQFIAKPLLNPSPYSLVDPAHLVNAPDTMALPPPEKFSRRTATIAEINSGDLCN
jgi:hypothetical protein